MHNIKQEINTKYNQIIKNITSDIDKCLISIKIDGVTRLNRCILGVNAQYIKDGKLKIVTLGMAEMTNSHTGEYLKQEVNLSKSVYLKI